jgi:hypothetical protein
VIKSIRTGLGNTISFIAALIAMPLFKLSELLNPNLKEKEEVQKKEKIEKKETPILFKRSESSDVAQDIHSYLNDITQANDRSGACMAVCSRLKEVSIANKGPVKLVHTSCSVYEAGAILESSESGRIYGFNGHRWHQLNELKISGSNAVDIFDEMTESLAQDGWACMNNATTYLFDFIAKCLVENDSYAEQLSKRSDCKPRIRTQLSLILDASGSVNSTYPYPKLNAEISLWTDRFEKPIVMRQEIYFAKSDSKLNTQA